MPENEIKTETENDFSNVENVSAKDLAGIEFPPVNTAAVAATVGSDNSAKIPADVPPSAPDGWDGNIHTYPPRKNKKGEWAKKRGNKKGYVFGKPKNENPPLNIPQDAEKIAAEAAELEKKLAEQTRAAAEMAANGVILAANAFSGYAPEEVFRAAYIDAWERYLNSFGGVNLPLWVEVALMPATIAVNAARREEAKPKLQRFKEWIAGKIYAFRNRRKARKSQETDAA